LLAAAFPLSRGPAVKRNAAGSKEEGGKKAGKTFYSTELLVWKRFGRGRKLQPERWQELIVTGMNVSFFESDAGV
jgi:hypothetical protein